MKIDTRFYGLNVKCFAIITEQNMPNTGYVAV